MRTRPGPRYRMDLADTSKAEAALRPCYIHKKKFSNGNDSPLQASLRENSSGLSGRAGALCRYSGNRRHPGVVEVNEQIRGAGAVMELALLNLITFAALGVAEPFSRV
jgi:hypothetical protein